MGKSCFRQQEEGIALTLAVVLLILLFIMFFGILSLNMARNKDVLQQRDYLQAFYLAEAGINRMLYEANKTYPPADIPETEPFGSGNGSYTVDFTSGTFPDLDNIVSTGDYHGRKRRVKIEVRDDIAEAFNKHAIYARNVDIRSTVIGNICHDDLGTDSVINAGSEWTETIVDPVNFGLPTPNINGYAEPPAVYVSTYTDNNDPNLDLGEGSDSTGGGPSVSYNPLTDTYTFSNVTISSSTIVHGNVILNGSTSVFAFFRVGKNITIDNNVTILEKISSGGNIAITGTTINSNIAAGGDIVLEGADINASVAAGGNIVLKTTRCTLNPQVDEAALVSESGNVILEDASHEINGLIYSGNCIEVRNTVPNSQINGALVARISVTLYRGTVTYDATNFKTITPVYRHFSGGRRVYLPQIRSWEEI